MNDLKISVIICTYNRARYLGSCVASVLDQSLQQELYEVIVVDNNSSDNTEEICQKFQGRPYFRRVVEPKQGLSHARNRGLSEASAPLVAYIDDDATAVPEWLSELVAGYRLPEVASVGGAILPLFESDPPPWFDDSLLPLYSCRDRGRKVMELGPGLFFYGANMSFRRDVLEQVGGFPLHLGRKGNNLLSDEELVVSARVEALGYKKLYMPSAVVHHCISKERLKVTWLLQRFYWLGRGEAIRDMQVRRSLIGQTAMCLKQLKEFLVNTLEPAYRAGWATRLLPLAILFGYMWQLLSLMSRTFAVRRLGPETGE